MKIVLALVVGSFFAVRDGGNWATDTDVSRWFQGLMQPDNPRVSCCGKADAYYADSWVVRDGKTWAIITDTREDAPLGRPHVEPGTEVMVPDAKLKWDEGNPTGHGVVFLASNHDVLCYVVPGGV